MNESGHYYDLKGKAVFEVPNKTKGGYRKTTLRDCKALNLIPSVTTIFKCLASPELDRWKQQQVLMASLTLPRQHDESDEDYCSRIMQDAFKQVDDAADLGTNIHKALENHFQGEAYDPVMECYVEPVKKWVEKNNVTFLKHELRLVNPEVGYAGTTDALIMKDGVLHILDYKGLACDTPIFTTNGWSTMLDLKVGDSVFSPFGKSVKVKGKSQIHHRDCYKIKFDDSSEIIADNVHLWKVNVGTVGNRKEELVSTEILYSYKQEKKILTIPLAAPVELPDADLPIDPYLLGCWIGDGTRNRSEISISVKKEGIKYEFEKAGYSLRAFNESPNCSGYYIADGFRKKLLSLNLGMEKIIPEMYFTASANQRLELLRGLMDTDGNWNICRNQVQMNLINPKLADQIVRIVASLGMRVYRTRQKGTGFGKEFIKDMIAFTPNGVNVFKRNKFNFPKNEERKNGTGFSRRRAIVSIEKIPSVPTCCIEVDSNDSMFLVGNDFIPTHNSRKTKPDFEIKPWAKEPMQIAAYAKVAGAVRGVNLYISTTEPGRIGEAWYDEKTLNENYEAFTHICKYWQFSTGYQPPKK
jgi:hypothetical protein